MIVAPQRRKKSTTVDLPAEMLPVSATLSSLQLPGRQVSVKLPDAKLTAVSGFERIGPLGVWHCQPVVAA